MQRHECNNQSFSRILFYSLKTYVYIYYKIIVHYLEKRDEKQVKKRVTPEFGEYHKRNFIPLNLGCYSIEDLARVIY
jgi:hypothetical protein